MKKSLNNRNIIHKECKDCSLIDHNLYKLLYIKYPEIDIGFNRLPKRYSHAIGDSYCRNLHKVLKEFKNELQEEAMGHKDV